jgi:hypothetical protein
LTIFNTLRKRLSNGITKSVNVTVAEDDGLEKLKKAALKGLGEKIIANINVARLGAGREAAIGGKANGTFVVLFDNVAGDGVSLGFHKSLVQMVLGR